MMELSLFVILPRYEDRAADRGSSIALASLSVSQSISFKLLSYNEKTRPRVGVSEAIPKQQAIYQVVLGCSSPRSFTVENKYHPRRQLVRCEVNASFVS